MQCIHELKHVLNDYQQQIADSYAIEQAKGNEETIGRSTAYRSWISLVWWINHFAVWYRATKYQNDCKCLLRLEVQIKTRTVEQDANDLT